MVLSLSGQDTEEDLLAWHTWLFLQMFELQLPSSKEAQVPGRANLTFQTRGSIPRYMSNPSVMTPNSLPSSLDSCLPRNAKQSRDKLSSLSLAQFSELCEKYWFFSCHHVVCYAVIDSWNRGPFSNLKKLN